MLGRLSGNPNVLNHLFEAMIFEETILRQLMIFWTRGRPLKRPILNDRLQRQPSGVYPRSAHVRVIQFQIIYL